MTAGPVRPARSPAEPRAGTSMRPGAAQPLRGALRPHACRSCAEAHPSAAPHRPRSMKHGSSPGRRGPGPRPQARTARHGHGGWRRTGPGHRRVRELHRWRPRPRAPGRPEDLGPRPRVPDPAHRRTAPPLQRDPGLADGAEPGRRHPLRQGNAHVRRPGTAGLRPGGGAARPTLPARRTGPHRSPGRLPAIPPYGRVRAPVHESDRGGDGPSRRGACGGRLRVARGRRAARARAAATLLLRCHGHGMGKSARAD